MSYEIKKTELKNKNRYDVVNTETGEVIGTRQSKRDYVKAVVVRASKDAVIRNLKASIKYNLAEAERYSKFVGCVTLDDCLALGWKPRARAYKFDCELQIEKLNDGSYAKWVKSESARAEQKQESLDKVLAGDWSEYPETENDGVQSYHQSLTAKYEDPAKYGNLLVAVATAK